jgi:hypothetical protein
MEIVEVPFEIDPEEIKSGLASDVMLLEPRSPGVHQSDLIRDLENTVILPGQRGPDIDRSEEEMATLNRYRELGMMWEVILESTFKRRRVDALDPRKFLRQMEIEHDGVFKTVDAVHIPDWRILEYKLTFKSSDRASLDRIETDMWGWFAQLKGNCLGWETRTASLFAFFVNGNYRPPVPQTKRFDIVFTEQELAENWHMLLTQRDVMRREGRLPE